MALVLTMIGEVKEKVLDNTAEGGAVVVWCVSVNIKDIRSPSSVDPQLCLCLCLCLSPAWNNVAYVLTVAIFQ